MGASVVIIEIIQSFPNKWAFSKIVTFWQAMKPGIFVNLFQGKSVKHQSDRRRCFRKVVHKQEHDPPVQPVWIPLNMLNDEALCKKAIRHVSVRLIRSPSRVNNSLSPTWILEQSLKTCCKCCHSEPYKGVSHQHWMFKKDSAGAAIVPLDFWM